MPHFTRQIELGGPLVNAVVIVSAARQAALAAANVPIPKGVPVRALIDTGASCTCIDPGVFAALQLTPTGSVAVLTPSTGAAAHNADQFDVGLVIPGATNKDVPLILPTVAAVASVLHVQGIQALIGRDILSLCVLNYNGTMGLFTLAY